VRMLGRRSTPEPVHARTGAAAAADRPDVGALADGDGETEPAAVFAELYVSLPSGTLNA
jgi:hypothetical protein